MDGTRTREATFPPDTQNNPVGPTEVVIPTTQAQRLQLVLRPPKNTLDGVSFTGVFPA